MRGVLRTKHGRGKRAVLTQPGFLGLKGNREMCFLFQVVPEGALYTAARPVLNSNTWLFSFLFFFFHPPADRENKALAHHTSTYFHTRRVSI